MKKDTEETIKVAITTLRAAGESLRIAAQEMSITDIPFNEIAKLSAEAMPAAFETAIIRATLTAQSRESFIMANALEIVIRTRGAWRTEMVDGVPAIAFSNTSGVTVSELMRAIPALEEMLATGGSDGDCDCPACALRKSIQQRSVN